MAIAWDNFFDSFGIKKVSKTDKSKKAYVPNAEQIAAISAAEILPSPSHQRPAHEFKITVLNDNIRSIAASYYQSIRAPDPTRSPEARIGHAFISSDWLNVGDRVVIGNIGSEVFATKLTSSSISEDEIEGEILKKATARTIFERAMRSHGKPPRRIITRNDYLRDQFVVAAAINRANHRCEMPQCRKELFIRDDGQPYLEVHHVLPLGEGGEDTLVNVAALCPHCHRELHFGKSRRVRRIVLAKKIRQLMQ